MARLTLSHNARRWWVALALTSAGIVAALAYWLWVSRVPSHMQTPQPGDIAMRNGVPVAHPLDPFKLENQKGEPYELTQFHGKTLLLNFAFTGCSSTCPTTAVQLNAVRQRISKEPDTQVEFVTVTVDPLSDDVPALAKYTQSLNLDLKHWQWLTGKPDEVTKLITLFGGYRDTNKNPADHLTALYMIDALGRVIGRFQGTTIDQSRLVRELVDLDRSIGQPARLKQGAEGFSQSAPEQQTIKR